MNHEDIKTVRTPETVKNLKKGEFFKRTATAKKVYTRGDYDRSLKKFECMDEDDISQFIYLKGSVEIITEFEY